MDARSHTISGLNARFRKHPPDEANIRNICKTHGFAQIETALYVPRINGVPCPCKRFAIAELAGHAAHTQKLVLGFTQAGLQ
jgi:hypothetical protein